MQAWNHPGQTNDREFDMGEDSSSKYTKYSVRKIITQAMQGINNHDDVVAIAEYLIDKMENQVIDAKDVLFSNYIRENLLVDLITARSSDKNYPYLILMLDRIDAMVKY